MAEPGVLQPSYLTYFETLPDDVRVKQIEWLNMVWYEESDYEKFLDTGRLKGGSSLLCLLLAENSLFCYAASTLLTLVNLSPVRNSTNVSFENRLITIGPELFESEEKEEALAERLLKVCGESIKEIMFAVRGLDGLHRGGEGNRFVEQFATLVLQYCPGVDRLEFDLAFLTEEVPSTLLAAYASQLRSVVWHTWELDNDIPLLAFTNCTQIRDLSLRATLKTVTLLESIGSSLERFSLTFDTFEGYGIVLDTIERNCKKLMHVSLHDSRSIISSVGEERYANFLCSYGAQLSTAEIDGMVDPKHLQKVFAKCLNLKVKSQTVFDAAIEEWERVRVFGSRIENLMVDLISCTCEESCNAVSSCTSLSGLTTLNIDGVAHEQDIYDTAVVSLLSSLSTTSLKYLVLSLFRATEENVAMIVGATSNLILLELRLVEPLQNGGIFKSIVDSNPHLRVVFIEESEDSGGERNGNTAVELLQVLVNTFSKCNSLAFSIKNTEKPDVPRDTIRNTCRSLPCRGIELNVKIGSTSYKQTRRLDSSTVFLV